MQVDPDKLISHLKARIPHHPADVNSAGTRLSGQTRWRRVSSKGRLECPLHADPDRSLSASEGEPTIFRCSHPSCRFRGDAAALASAALGIALPAAAAMFGPGRELAHCLSRPMRQEDLEAYLDGANAQSEVAAYLSKCSAALRRSPEKSGVRAGMSALSLRLLHPDMGLFLPDPPRCLREFSKPRYRNSTLLLFPYRMDGEITRIEVLDPDNPVFRHVAVVSHPESGVFGELPEGDRQVLAVERPEVAAALYAAFAAASTRQPPVCAFQGYPLPESFREATSITILSTVDAPVSTEFLLRTLCAPSIRPGRPPNMRVAHVQSPYRSLKAQELGLVRTGAHRATYDLPHMVARSLAGMVKDGRSQAVLDMLASEGASEAVRRMVADAARAQLESKGGFYGDPASCEALLSLLESPAGRPSCDMALANGRTFHCGPSSVKATQPGGRSEVLCNVGLSVESKILSRDGEEIFLARVAHPDDVPVVEVSLKRGDFTADRLRNAVQKAFAEAGASPYVAFYTVPGFSWPDVMSRLAEHCAVSREISCLGSDGSAIHFPEAVVGADGSVGPQDGVFTMDREALGMYAGVSVSRDATLEPWKKLLEDCGSLVPAAFCLGAMHVVFQATHGLGVKGGAAGRMQRHFFYAETEPGVWGGVFGAVASLFSGGGPVPVVNYSRPEETMEGWTALGALPAIAKVPTTGARLASALESTGRNLLGLVDSTTAVMVSGRVPAAWIMPMDENAPPGRIDGGLVDALRESFAAFLAKFARDARIDQAYRSASLPCMAAYREACRVMGVEEKLPGKLAMEYFPGVGMSGMDMFLDMFHRALVDEGGRRICVVDKPPTKDTSFTRRGQHVFILGDRVVVSNAVFDILRDGSRKTMGGRIEFDRAQVAEDMESAGMCAGFPEELWFLDRGRCFCMSRDAWEKRVVRPSVQSLEPVDPIGHVDGGKDEK